MLPIRFAQREITLFLQFGVCFGFMNHCFRFSPISFWVEFVVFENHEFGDIDDITKAISLGNLLLFLVILFELLMLKILWPYI